MTESLKKLLEKKQQHATTTEEDKIIEEKLNEFSILQDLYFEKESDFEETDIHDTLNINQLKKNYNRKFFHLGVKIFLSLLIFFSLGFFVLRPILEKWYYNPTTTQEDSQLSNHQVMLDIYTQLTNPHYILTNSIIEKDGFARYRVQNTYQPILNQNSVYAKPEVETYTFQYGNIQISESTPYFSVHPPLLKMTLDNETAAKKIAADFKKRTLATIQELPKSSQLFSVISFNHAITVDELHALFSSEDTQNGLKWAAVEISEVGTGTSLLGLPIGFSANQLNLSNTDYNIERNKEYPELYPYSFIGSRESMTSKNYEQQFLSMLDYSIDHYESEVNHLSHRYDKKLFEDARNYVQKKGLKINAIYFTSSPDVLEAIIQNRLVWNVEILDSTLYRTP
uniref:anti sigma factor C-terminal domain-containing protein n=1 Tax=Candidatus Enterococcus willemsii TaxID=1857215 RepID=UPI00403F7FD9